MARKWNLSCNSFSSSFQLEFWRHGWSLKSRSWSFEECWYNGMIEICVPGLSMPKNKSVSIMLCHVENWEENWRENEIHLMQSGRGKKTSPAQPGPVLNPLHTTNFLPREAWQFFTRIQLKLLKQYWDGNSGTINIHRVRRDIYGHPFCI